jgi:hypothetical protein
VAAAFLLAVPGAFAQFRDMAYWTFNDAVPVGGNQIDASVRNALFSADGGVYASTATMSSNFFFADGTTAAGSQTGITSVPGTSMNSHLPPPPIHGSDAPPGQGLGLQGGVGGNNNNGRFLEFGTSTVGFHFIKLDWAMATSATGFNTLLVQASADGGATYGNFGNFSLGNSLPYGTYAVDLSRIFLLYNNPDVRFRFVFSGATSNLGDVRIDNLQIHAIGGPSAPAPEPAPGMLLLLGLGCLGGLRLVRRKGRSYRFAGGALCARNWRS